MKFANPAGLWLLLFAVPVLALHVLRPQRRRTMVSSTLLWQRAERPVSAAQPWQRLRPSWLLLAQLLIVGALAIAVARPVRLGGAALARHTVFVIDTSGSMDAADGAPTRLDAAKVRATQLRDQLPGGGIASIVTAGLTPRVLLSASPDRDAFVGALDAIGPATGAPDMADALTLAASMETPDAPVGFVLLSDGGLTEPERKLLPAGTRYERVGETATNRAITQLAVESRSGGLTAHVTVRSTGGARSTEKLRIDVDGRTAWIESLTLEPAQTLQRSIDVPAGDRVEAFLEGEDLLAADNHAFAPGAARPTTKVLVAGPADPYLDRLLAVVPGVSVDRVAASKSADGYDVAVFDQVAVPATPGAPFIAIAPPGGAPGVTVSGVAEQPPLTLVATDDPLLQGLDLSGVGVARAQALSATGDRVLLGSETTPLVITGTRQGRQFAYFGFALADSNLPVQVAYPLFFDRLLSQLSGAVAAVRDLRVGDALPVDGAIVTQVQAPGGTRYETAAGAAAPRADRPGFWTIRAENRPDRTVAVNAPERESALAPVAAIDTGTRPTRPGERPVRRETSLLRYVAIMAIALLATEFLLGRRRRGVARWQWRLATGLRAAVGLLLLLALLAPSVDRPRGAVATMFLVDGSDSMGGSGRDAAVRWVRDALAAKPRSARAGVAVFGGDARLELTMQQDPVFSSPSVKVDTTQTNLARALRLAAAVLPTDARRRIVIVSDGRATTGDTDQELARLKAAGIPVDVHVVESNVGGDVSVNRVDAVGSARPGETITVRATITSTTGGPARVQLQRDGTTVDERTIDTVVGDTPVAFDAIALAPGTERFQVTVSQAADSVAQNDSGFAAVQVLGPARVLVVEGSSTEGAPIAEALRAASIPVDTVGVRDLPGLDVLSGYASTVLVDVDAAALSSAQVSTLLAASRDLGKGLVAIGGQRAYELGGYRNSELEALLPVVSEVLDPKRKLDVAQVLAIDTSGSMAACHCAEGSSRGANGMPIGGTMTGGGIDKTEISRAAAARTIQALDANDELGLLAFNTEQQWILPLAKLPTERVVTEGLGRLHPEGGTDLHQPLLKAAEALKQSKARLKHVILFTDGFSSTESLDTLVQQATQLADEGITVSVLATGEVAYQELEKVAVAGRGRFYAGRDLNQVPQIMAQEAIIAARDVVVEGTLLPSITSNAAVVRNLDAAPPLLGYVATTAKPTATTHLKIGPEGDPLLASWQVGLGRATAWTSDAATRWSKNWASWGGYVSFWSAVVRDTFPAAGSADGTVQVSVVGDRLKITVERSGTWGDATASARVTGPDLQGREVALARAGDDTFVGETDAGGAGAYAVGVAVDGPGGHLLDASALATQSYSAEYRAGPSDAAQMQALSDRTGGRGAIDPAEAFVAAGLEVGHRRVPLSGWFLLAAAILWPAAVALGLLALHGSALSRVTTGAQGMVRQVWQRRPKVAGTTERRTRRDRATPPRDRDRPPEPVAEKASAAEPDTVRRLLARKRGEEP